MLPIDEINKTPNRTDFSVFNCWYSVFSVFQIRTSVSVSFFRLDALAKALSVIATATWLGGWVAGWLAGWLGVRHTPVLYQNG